MEKKALAVREQQWYQTITAGRQSGQSIKSWCTENGVALSSFYGWQRRIRNTLLQESAPVQIEELQSVQEGTAESLRLKIVLHALDISVEIPADLPARQLSEIIRGIRNAG